jgi:glycerate kinase
MDAGKAATDGLKAVYPDCEIICLAVADGGEGMLKALISETNGSYVTIYAHNPLMEVINTHYGILGDGKTALIEMASISGLPLIPADKRNPSLTTSFGTGELIKDALDRGCRDFIVGIGGSATNDAGLGMLQALGFRFIDKNGRILDTGGKIMAEVADIDFSSVHQALKEAKFTIACDVNNPFFGPEGAAFVFAPQKGADEKMVKELDAGLESLSEVILRVTGKEIANYPGAGAAGGMGGGFLAFLNATLKSGIDLLLDVLDFDKKIENANLIITGEGRVDRQTIRGKVPSGILARAKMQQIPIIVIAGSIEDVAEMNRAGFQGVFSITPGPVSLKEAMEPNFAKENIKRLISQLCHTIYSFKS